MIKDPHKQNIVELALNRINIIDGTLGKLDFQAQHLGGKARLVKVTIIHVNAQNPAGATFLEFDGMEAAIATDVEHRSARKVRRQRGSNVLPLDAGKIAQEVLWRGQNAIQVDVMKPLTHFRDTTCEFLMVVQIRGYVWIYVPGYLPVYVLRYVLADVCSRCDHSLMTDLWRR
jgi:hypothetical protein